MSEKPQYPPLRSPMMVNGQLTDPWVRYFQHVVTPYFERLLNLEDMEILDWSNNRQKDHERRIAEMEKLVQELWQTSDRGLTKRLEDLENALQFVDGPKDATLLRKLDELELLIYGSPRTLLSHSMLFHSDVKLVGLADTDLMRWDAASFKWLPKSIQEIVLGQTLSILTLDITGGQIAFPATAVPSADPNTLDDYEKGTFTVTLTLGGGTATVHASYNTFSYRKIGDLCYIQGYIYISAVNIPSGSVTLNGLPFTSGSLPQNSDISLFTFVPTEITGTLSGTPIGRTDSAQTTISLIDKVWDSTGFVGDWGDHLDADCWINISGHYITA